ncbi:jhy protein homolog [Hemitrygon akajei]|uniref:jhy protein homolog n=1 Tax=Hemitrygon akajei TaxID=2704970 RepID=UPI003BF99985
MITMDANKNPTLNRMHFNQETFIQSKEVPARPLPLEEGDAFHVNLYDSLESDSDSLIQEEQYQLELKHRIQKNEELVFRTFDIKFDIENGDDDESLYDSLEEPEVENNFDGNKSETDHKSSEEARNHTNDKYASLRYDPNWRNTREGTEILLSKDTLQQQSPHVNNSLMNLLQESNDSLEDNVAISQELKHPDLLKHKKLTNNSHGARFSVRKNGNNAEKQSKKQRPPSPSRNCDSNQEECDSFDFDDNSTTNLQNHKKITSENTAKMAPWVKNRKNKCHSVRSDNEVKDHKYRPVNLLEQKRQMGKSQGVRFSLRENENNEEKQSKRKRPPSPYCKNIESSQEECDSLDSLGSYETNKSDFQKDMKITTDNILETGSQDDQGKNKHLHEEDFEKLNDHYQKEYMQYWECESMHSDESTNCVKSRNVPEISCDRKLQTKERSGNDIVARNKQTLGARKITSYQQLYNEMKTRSTQEVSTTKSSKTMTVRESKQNTVDGQENSTEMKWMQRAQRLQNCKTKQLSTKKKGLMNMVREKPPRPPDKPSTKQHAQKTQKEEKMQHIEDAGARQNKNTSDLLIVHRDDDSVPLTPSSDHTFASSLHSQVGPAFIPNLQPTVNLNIHLNTSSDFIPAISSDTTQTTVRLVPSHHPMSQDSSYYKSHKVYNALQPQNPLPYFQDSQGTIHNSHQYSTGRSKFLTTLNPRENGQRQLMYNVQSPFEVRHAQTHHDLMLTPKYHQAAYARTLVPGLYNQPRLNPMPYSMNQEKAMTEDHNSFGKEYGSLGFPALPFLSSHQQNLVQSTSTRLIQQMENIYKDTPRLAHTHPDSHMVLPSIYPMAESDSELDARPNKKILPSMIRCNSDGYLAQMEKVNKLKEKKHYKPYTMRDHINIKQDVKLGGLGPDYKSIQEKAKKMKRQKEYAKQIKEQNLRDGCKSSSSPQKQPTSTENKNINSSWKLAKEYAKSIHKPKPLPANSKVANEMLGKEKLTKLGQCVQLDPSENTMLEMMQDRHEKEKQIVAAFKAMHMT